MTEYTRGFLEGIQAACIMGEGKFDHHLKNAEDKSLSEEYQSNALACTMIIGSFVSDLKCLGASVHRGQQDPSKIATANGSPFWWATADGKGRS